jgi:hypothetical protein
MRILIGVAVPVDRNVTQKEAENKLKYKSECGTRVYDHTGNNWRQRNC